MNPYDTPSMDCPYCQTPCHADFVDNGVGMVQCGPYHCFNCQASEIGPEMAFESLTDENGWYVMGDIINPEDFSEMELKTGWYEPGSGKISPHANTSGGVLVDHQTAKMLYDIGLLDEKKL